MPDSPVAPPRTAWHAPDRAKQLPVATYLTLLRQAVAAAPGRADFELQLARALYHAGLVTELLQRFGPAAADAGTHPEMLFHVGCGALSANDDRLAADALSSSAAAGFARAHGKLAEALHRARRYDDALRAGLRALETSPFDFAALRVVARTLLARGEKQRLWDVCTELRARGAWSGYVPSVMVLAATTPEQDEEVAALIDPARWFDAAQLPVVRDFNRRLAAELLAHPARTALSATKSTSGTGSRIDELELAGGPLVRELLGLVRHAVDAYADERKAAVSHPMIAHRPASAALSSWAVAVERDGHEGWHLHPDGWLSGVYYVHVPETDTRAGGRAGAIEFGPHPFAGTREDAPWPRRHVAPRAGLLLLFPSYYGHRTWPTGVDEPRLCVAFDVVADALRDEPPSRAG
ncbi:MAG: hypothetical protein JWM87_1118 [Candidatus Eremiobacteraeota bacterium]|nr:hypothetical protein [Candidatus Eremiobacteraeota bacterium]